MTITLNIPGPTLETCEEAFLAEMEQAMTCSCLSCCAFIADTYGIPLASVVPSNGIVH